MIPFNIPPYVGTEMDYVRQAAESNRKICGDGPFTIKCQKWMQDKFQASKVLLTTSGTAALEMAALLCGIKPGDEVIMPSFTFSSTATAFALFGARIVFVDIRPDTMNINESLVEAAITERTKAIVVMHYGGVSCEMDAIMDIANRHNLLVVEDAAQGVMASYKSRALGAIGTFGCYSFHETKNYSMGEGGALVINDPNLIERAEIIREKGTNRTQFHLGQVDKYTWVDLGSSYLPSDMNAAYLWAQLQMADKINNDRLKTWNTYYKALSSFAAKGRIELPIVPSYCKHNAHLFYIKLANLNDRTVFIDYMKSESIGCVFHYIPLHSSPAGQLFGRFQGADLFTTCHSERLARLPMYYSMSEDDVNRVIEATINYLNG